MSPLETQAAEQHAVTLHAVSKVYGSSRGTSVTALRDVTMSFPAGTFTAIIGPSGSGKSTLLQCAAGLDRPTSGQIHVAGQELGSLVVMVTHDPVAASYADRVVFLTGGRVCRELHDPTPQSVAARMTGITRH